MDVGAELWVFFLGGAAIVGAAWLLWVRFIGLPRDDPTSSPSQLGDLGVSDLQQREPGDHPPA